MSTDNTQVGEALSVGLQTVIRPVSPDLLKLLITSTLSADAALRPLLGVAHGDPRVYWYYNPAAIIDSTKRAYITYMHSALPERTQATGDPVFSISVWAINGVVLEAVRDRIVALFEEQPLTLSNGRRVWSSRLGEHDNYQENTQFAGKNLQFRFGYSQV